MWSAQADEFIAVEGLSLRDIASCLEAEALCCHKLLDRIITRITATDLMSRVLADAEPGTLLMTALNNMQVVNTAEVAGLSGVVFLMGVWPSEALVQKASIFSVPILVTRHGADSARFLLGSVCPR